jgi:hypothetical protein
MVNLLIKSNLKIIPDANTYVPDPDECSYFYNCSSSKSSTFLERNIFFFNFVIIFLATTGSEIKSERLKCPELTSQKTQTKIQLLFSPKYYSCVLPSDFPANSYPTPEFPRLTCNYTKTNTSSKFNFQLK